MKSLKRRKYNDPLKWARKIIGNIQTDKDKIPVDFKSISFPKFTLPLVKNIDPKFTLKDFMSVQPMTKIPKGLVFKMYCIDKNNPQIGQIFETRLKDGKEPHCGCCKNGDDYWHQIYTDEGWVFEEKVGKEEFQKLSDDYKELRDSYYIRSDDDPPETPFSRFYDNYNLINWDNKKNKKYE